MADSASGQSGTLARCLGGWPDGVFVPAQSVSTRATNDCKSARAVGRAGGGCWFLFRVPQPGYDSPWYILGISPLATFTCT